MEDKKIVNPEIVNETPAVETVVVSAENPAEAKKAKGGFVNFIKTGYHKARANPIVRGIAHGAKVAAIGAAGGVAAVLSIAAIGAMTEKKEQHVENGNNDAPLLSPVNDVDEVIDDVIVDQPVDTIIEE